ncbi:hypothetical protein WG907_05910 [Sphingobium sp. AN558]|uniref:hypothetical protein n=1 Tax=Sphingobium sp. AN558 TaxID=3133442 RepID=UPI0030BA7688
MSRSDYRADTEKGGTLFLAALWLTIMLALVCALTPLGPPSSRQAGSAFNPATSAVALKSRSSVPSSLLQTADPDGSDRSLPEAPVAILPVDAVVIMSAAAGVDAFVRLPPAGPPAAIGLTRRLARAPPFPR